MDSITPQDVSEQFGHWLGCPVNGYLGSDYGSDMKSLLHAPLSSGSADELIAKARHDIPVLTNAPPGVINVYAESKGPDAKNLYFEVLGEVISVSKGSGQ